MPPSSQERTPGHWDTALLAVQRDYVTYGRVDDELRWAPFLCREPLPGRAHPSTSVDDATHGQKLCAVFARVQADYPAKSAVGQMVVTAAGRIDSCMSCHDMAPRDRLFGVATL